MAPRVKQVAASLDMSVVVATPYRLFNADAVQLSYHTVEVCLITVIDNLSREYYGSDELLLFSIPFLHFPWFPRHRHRPTMSK